MTTASVAHAASLPDGRSYEQASPVDKDGGDVTGKAALVKAAAQGGGITFASTFGIPGGRGAQQLPMYLALRGTTSWSTQGLLPPESTGERDRVIGWLPDFSESYTKAVRLETPRTEALFSQASADGALRQMTPYVTEAKYAYDGAAGDGAVVLFEATAALPPKEGQAPIAEARQGDPNVYAWDRESGEVHLASVLNGEAETKAALPHGATAGTSFSSSYLQDERTVGPGGSVYFTANGSGQLYERINPTKPQSPMSAGKCEDPTLACTFHVSATEKTNGKGPGGSDPAGEQLAEFQAASVDGRKAFFTSSGMLTNDAKTGPEQPLPAVASAKFNLVTEKAEEVNDEFIPAQHAIGVAVDGAHIYWADPTKGTIGRANLDGSEPNDSFIVPGPVTYEVEVEPGVIEEEEVPTKPRYVAVQGGRICWTNTGMLKNAEGEVIDGGGTVGCADLEGEEAKEVKPDCIRGASNPQGIAISPTHVYWVNAGDNFATKTIGRAELDCEAAELSFHKVAGSSEIPAGVAVSSEYLYYDTHDTINGFILRIPLAGGAEKFLDGGGAGIRGIAIGGAHVYWANQSKRVIGRANLELEEASKENEWLKVEGEPVGVAANATHIFWSINGEAPTNPGSDLYRFDAGAPAGSRLTDLSVDHEAGDQNGAEVQGVLGVSPDGSRVYFAANGKLTPSATKGSCHAEKVGRKLNQLGGKCNLYLWHEGTLTFIAPFNANGGSVDTDALDWVQTPFAAFSSGSWRAKTAFLGDEGQTLLFRSQEKLSAYDNEGVPELYRYREGGGVSCVSCPPGEEAPEDGPTVGTIDFPALSPGIAGVLMSSSRNLADEGRRAFFETKEALLGSDQNETYDVYEWEAPEAGSCTEASPSYSTLNGGCLYLISTGESPFPSRFGDASESGEDVFFFTRQSLVGQDKDELQDVYDARVGGGLAAQNPAEPPPPCESAEACHGPLQSLPGESSPATPGFHGPSNPKPKHAKHKHKKRKRKHHRHHRRAGR